MQSKNEFTVLRNIFDERDRNIYERTNDPNHVYNALTSHLLQLFFL